MPVCRVGLQEHWAECEQGGNRRQRDEIKERGQNRKPDECADETDIKDRTRSSETRKDRPEGKSKPYDMTGTTPPESFTNSKTYFVAIYNNVWEQTRPQKLALVFSALTRIDPTNPGKIKPLDYSDQEEMVSNFGANWHERGDLPDLLSGNVDLR